MLKELFTEHSALVIEHYTVAPLSKEKNMRLLKIRRKLNRWEEIRRRTYILGHPECMQNTIMKSLTDLKEKLDELMELLK